MQDKKIYLDETQNGMKTGVSAFAKYLAYYPLFFVSLVLFIGAGYLYIRNTPPKYQATALLLLRSDDQNYSSSDDLIANALSTKHAADVKREIVQLTSGRMMKRVVEKHGYNTSYFLEGRVLASNVYKSAPFRLIIKEQKDSVSTVRFSVKEMTQKGGVITYGKENQQEFPFSWNTPFSLNKNTYVLVPQPNVLFGGDAVYTVQWRSPAEEAAKLSGRFSVTENEKESNVLRLQLITENVQLSEDILNSICAEYNLADIEERNKLSESTVRFIDERLSVISGELKSVEGSLENYQGSRNLIDIKSQADQSFENANTISNNIKELNIQQGIVSMIYNYFNNPNTSGKLVPSSMGLNDPTLAALIGQYNELQLKKDREAPLVGPNNLMIQDLNNQLANLKNSILESLGGISRNLKLQESRLQGHNTQYRQFLASLPHNERVLQEIKRKQGITEGLYLYLLQRREEAAISSTSASLSRYKQIDPAYGYGPVEPNKVNVYLSAVLLGLLLPFGFVYSKDLLNNKIESREEISHRIDVPVVGDVVHVQKAKSRIVSPTSRNLMSEQFRLIRTNLTFRFRGKQVFMITSSVAGEGKSTISVNLATVLAIPGKKVALLEFDIRKPAISKMLGLGNVKGITDYLSGSSGELSEICHRTEDLPTLHVYPSGPLPSNPADVLLTSRIAELFERLKKEYDYIVVDSAPAGMVADAFLLEQYCDATLYIVRQRFTQKKQLDFINDLHESGKLQNMAIIFNDVKTGGRYGYYGYGSDGKNGYYDSTGSGRGRTKIFFWRKSEKLQ